jgi:ATP/maltotriose-dependent transcriptional regulator MalT
MSSSGRRDRPARTSRAVLLERPRLETRLDEAFGKRLTTVVAGAGFGKTTLLANWARDVESGWHTATSTDRRLGSFTRRLVRTLQPFVADVSTDTGFQVSPPDEEMRADAIAARIAGELEDALHHDFVLVLDDVDELLGAPSARLVEGLVRQGPPTLHLILSGRSDPPFPVQRLRGQGQVLELDASELAFQPDEVGDLLELYVDADARELAPRIVELTGGWPAAVRLAIRTLEQTGKEGRADAVERLHRPEGPLLDYLSEEVLNREPPAVRRVIAAVAPFEHFTTELCEALGLVESRAALDSLRRRGLFMAADERGDGFLTLHALIREFARGRLHPGEEELRELHSRAASWFEARGRLEDALHSHMESRNTPELARFLADRGNELLIRGSTDPVVQAGALLDADLRDTRVEAILGEAHSLKGNWEEALDCYKRSAGDEHDLSAGLAWRMGRLYWDRGNIEEAKAVFERGRIDGSGSTDEALLLAWTSSPYWSAGDAQGARELADRALRAAKASGSPRALGAAHNAVALTYLGLDNGRFERHMSAALDAAETGGDVLQLIRFTINRCGPAEPTEAIELLGAAISLAELAGAGLYLARALNARGENYLAVGRFDDAVTDFRRALSLWERHGSARRAWALMSLASVARHRGDLAYARAAYREALEASTDAEGSINAQSGLARVLAYDDPEEAQRLAAAAVEEGRRFAPMLSVALLAAGWVALARGNRDAALAYGREAMAETHRQRTRFEYAEALELGAMTCANPAEAAGLLEESLAVWHEVGNEVAVARVELAIGRLSNDRPRYDRARRKLRAAGVREQAAGAAGLLGCLPPDEPELVRVRTLGSFALLREGQALPVGEWQSRKARDLLKILIARRGRAAPRDYLIDALWPGEDPARLGNRLSVALSILRSVLDPERRSGPDCFVLGGSTGVALRRESLPVDVEEFLTDAEAGLQLAREEKLGEARERLLAAEATYAGDFLEEDLYAEWATQLREEARLAYIAVGHALAELAAAEGDLADAARYLLRVLERDPHDERAHLALVKTLAEAGHHGEARRCYATYVARMGEIGVEASPYSPTRTSTRS